MFKSIDAFKYKYYWQSYFVQKNTLCDITFVKAKELIKKVQADPNEWTKSKRFIASSCPLIEHMLFFFAVFTSNNPKSHYSAIKAQKHIGGYGSNSSHMINTLTTLLSLPLPPLFFLSPLHHLSSQSINFPK